MEENKELETASTPEGNPDAGTPETPEEPKEQDIEIDPFEEKAKEIEERPKVNELDKAKFTQKKLKKDLFFVNKRIKDLGGEEETEDEFLEEKPEKVDIQELVKESVSQTLSESLYERDAENRISNLAKTPAEKNVYLYYFRNRILRTGNLEEDIDNAITLARKGVIKEENKSIKRTLSTKSLKSPYRGSGAKEEPKTTKTLTEDEKISLRKIGLTDEDIKKVEEKRARGEV